MSKRSIEHAWKLVSRGLHIHRYFLHVDPMLSRRLAGSLRSLSPSVGDHGFNPGHPDGWQSAVLEVLTGKALAGAALSMKTWELAAARGIVVLHHTADGPLVAPASSEPALREALALLSALDAAWLVRLIAGVIQADVRNEPGSAALVPRVLSIDLSTDPAVIADKLVRAAAAQLLELFALARFEHSLQESEPPNNLLARFRPLLQPLYEPFIAALLNRPPSGAQLSESALIELMEESAAAVNYLPFTDLLETTLPTSRQFRRFFDGLAPGQHA